MNSSRNKILFFLGVFLALAVALPLTVYLSQKQQLTESKANSSTTLSFSPSSSISSPLQKNPGELIPISIVLSPNIKPVSLITLEINYDSKILEPFGEVAFTPDKDSFPIIVEGPIYSAGKINVSLSAGDKYSKFSQKSIIIGTITFKALENTSSQTSVKFGSETKIFSLPGSDGKNKNIFSTSLPSFINIGNFLSALDYGTLLDCGYSEKEPLPISDPNSTFNSSSCKSHPDRISADVNHDGIINNKDLILYQKQITEQNNIKSRLF